MVILTLSAYLASWVESFYQFLLRNNLSIKGITIDNVEHKLT